MNGVPNSQEDLQRQVAGQCREIDECRGNDERLVTALRESNLRFEALLYNLPERVFHKDPESVYVSCNRNFARDFGLEPGDMVGKTDYDLFPHEIATKYRADDRRIMASGGTEEIVEDYCPADGEHRLIRTVKTVLRDNRGLVTGILGIFTDITEQKQAEDALRQARDELERSVEESTAELRQANALLEAEVQQRAQAEQALRETQQRVEMALEAGRSFAFEWEVATDRVVRSDGCSQILGLVGDAAVHDTGQGFFQRIHPDDRGRFVGMLGELRPSAASYRTEYRLNRGDGTTVVLGESGRGFFGSDGKLRRLVGVTTDITTQKRAEEALRESEARYKALVESSPDAVVMSDLEGRILFASQRAARQHGFDDPHDMMGRPAIEFVVAEDRQPMTENIQRLLVEGIRRNHEYRGLRRDGTTFFGEISASVITGPSGEPQALMAVYQDITERKKVEEAARESDAELLAVERIQAYLLPREAPQVAGLDIAGHCYSARGAAGDHFDFIKGEDGSLLIVLADVCGHGLGPALVAADFCARLRTLAEIPCELTEVVERIHAGLYGETAAEVFVTAILAQVDRQSRTVTCINAGHPPAIVLDAAGREKVRFESSGLPFAILERTLFIAQEPAALEQGDLLFFYTDGLTEAHREKQAQFGLERAIQAIRDHRYRTAKDIITAVHGAVCEYISPEKPRDDITMVVVKVQPGG